MHIALVRRVCSLKKAGAERYCVNLFRQLQRLGHRVTVLGEAIDDELRGEVEFIPVPVLKLTSWTRNRSFAENCGRAIRQHRFDAVHGLSRVDGLDCYRLTDPLQTHWVNVFYRRPLERWLQRCNPRHRALFAIERQLFGPQGPRRIIVQSHLDGRLLRDYFGVADDRIRRVCNGVDLQTFYPDDGADRTAVRDELQLGTDRPVVLFAAMDFRRKGLATLLKALAVCRTRDAVLLVVGNGDVPRYRQLAESLGVAGRVRFLGRRSDMPRFYRAADLFALPTIYEPFPNVNLEAMACGTPVVTTATAGGADLIRHGENGALIADAWAADELACQLDELLNLPSTSRNAMRAACLATAAQFPAERNARETIAVLQEAVRERLCA